MAEHLKSQYLKSASLDNDERKEVREPRAKPTAEMLESILDKLFPVLAASGKKYTSIGLEIGELVDEKNAAYGDSFTKAADFLQILYPNGIPVTAYTDALCIVRIFDKLMRLASDKGYNNERPYADIAGYAFLGLVKDRERAEAKEQEEATAKPVLDTNGAYLGTVSELDFKFNLDKEYIEKAVTEKITPQELRNSAVELERIEKITREQLLAKKAGIVHEEMESSREEKRKALAKQKARQAYLDVMEEGDLDTYYKAGMANEPKERRVELLAEAAKHFEKKTFVDNSVAMEEDSSEKLSAPKSYSVKSRLDRLR